MKKKLLIGILFMIAFSMKLISQNAYYSFLKSNYCEPKEYVKKVFENKDLVILCERDHREITQYNFLIELVSQPWFVSNVGVIIMEVPCRNIQPKIDELLFAESLAPNELNSKLRYICQNMTYFPLWVKTNLYYFLKNVYSVNQKLNKDQKIRVIGANVSFSWDEIKTRQEYDSFYNAIYNSRDKDMANLIIDWYSQAIKDNQRSKALVIMNYRHAYTNKYWTNSNVQLAYNTGSYIKNRFPDKTTNIYLHSYTYRKFLSLEKRHENGKWDKAYKENNNIPIGFKLAGSPFGQDHFDHFPYRKTDLKWENVFDHIVFYNPIKEFRISVGINGIVDDEFAKELNRRFEIIGKKLTKRTIAEYNTEKTSKITIW